MYFFGSTVARKSKPQIVPPTDGIPAYDIEGVIKTSKQKLPASQAVYLEKLENSVSRGDVKDQQVKVYSDVANFWKDSAKEKDLYIYYVSKAASLVESEKYLTFAARLILDNLREEPQALKRKWMADQAIALFEKAIALNPVNEDLKIGLASCYVFGKGMTGEAAEAMKGVQMLLGVVQRDSTNLQAHLVLGIGGVISGQYDKAISRLMIVVNKEPANVEAVSWLADAYAGKGDKSNALKWYEISKRLVNSPQYNAEVNERIKMLQ